MGNFIKDLYEKHYKPLLIFSVLLVVFSLGVIGYHYYKTGDFVNRGVTLTGGITLQTPQPGNYTTDQMAAYLQSKFPDSDISVESFSSSGVQHFDIQISGVNQSEFNDAIISRFPDLSISYITNNEGTVGPQFGESFFVQTLKAVFIAFLFMSIVVFLYFGESVKWKWISAIGVIVASLLMFYANTLILYILPILIFAGLIYIYIRNSIISFGIILCAISDVLFSLAIFILFGKHLNTEGVAAFLMLIGYSIDTDILLSVRVLKRKEGTVFSRVIGALKTGVTMSVCALIAVSVAYFVTNSLVIKEIMFILIAGLVGDIVFTWIQNAGIVRWFVEKKGWQ